LQRGALTFGIVLLAFALGYMLPGLYAAPAASPTPVSTVTAPAPTPTALPTKSVSPTLPASTVTARPSAGLSPSPTAPAVSASPSPARAPSPSAAPSPQAVTTATAAPPPAPTATAGPRVYVVQSGDTLSGIAEKFGVSVDAIVAANGLSSPDDLAEGQKLSIPAR
jgi:N-acetylmuramoyl-L-alanine amidase